MQLCCKNYSLATPQNGLLCFVGTRKDFTSPYAPCQITIYPFDFKFLSALSASESTISPSSHTVTNKLSYPLLRLPLHFFTVLHDNTNRIFSLYPYFT